MNNTFDIYIDNNFYKLKIIKRKNCKRITLRINIKTKQPVVSIPYSVTYEEAINFFKHNNKWVDSQLNQISSKNIKYHFANLTEISIAGDIFNIEKVHSKKNSITISNKNKTISLNFKDFSNESLIEKYFIKFLKNLASITFSNISQYKAEQIGANFAKVAVSDTTSKWGSCSSTKNLQYNYRLIMTPIFVIDYVISHEVAHLLELNHGVNFWNIVNKLTPYKNEASSWLKNNGKSLY